MTFVGSAGDLARRRRLRRAKLVATGLLVAMAVIFVVAWLGEDRYPALAYVRAAAEAGMVGALADWFAVTALFRRPLGLPIPHTAIIPRRKESIASALSEFVATNFLSAEVVRGKLANASVAHRVGRWLAEPAHADRVSAEAGSAMRGVIGVLSDDQLAELLAAVARRSLDAADVGPPLGRVAAEVFERGDHRPLVDLVVDRCYGWIQRNRTAVETIVAARAPGWSPRFVDSYVAHRIYREIATFALAVKTEPDHPLRQSLDRFLAEFARDLQSDPAMRSRAHAVVQRIAGNEQLRLLASSAWSSVKRTVMTTSADPDSPLRRQIAAGVAAFGRRLAEDDVMAGTLDASLADAATYVATHHARALTGIIDDTIARWDGAQTARTIELHIGKDLQFIRVNGTVIGALAGLAIYSVAHLLLG